MAYTFDISDNRRIVEALKTGDEETFKEVYTAFCAPLRHYATTILQNEQAAYEVVQDVFTAVWLNRKRLDAAKPLRNYLLRAVHNNSLRLLKYDEARRRREISAAAELHGGCGRRCRRCSPARCRSGRRSGPCAMSYPAQGCPRCGSRCKPCR